ncbi:MAG: hypothetical protein V7724_04355 [Sediminicola sp.]
MFKNPILLLAAFLITTIQISCSKDDNPSNNGISENTFLYKENTLQITSVEIREMNNFKTEYLIRTDHDVIFFIYFQYRATEYQNTSHGNITYTVDSPLYLEETVFPNFSVRGYMYDNSSFQHFRLIDGKVRVNHENNGILKMHLDELTVKEWETEEQFNISTFINLPIE